MESIIPKLGLTKNIKLFGQVDDVAKWFEMNDINYLLTTSPFESFGYAMAEAMAMGYSPLIHAFPSAEQIWPTDCIFGCIDDLLQLIQDRENYDSRKYREFVETRYSLQSQLEKIEGVLKETADEISSEAIHAERRCRSEGHKRWNIPPALARYHRPEKTVIVTGIPRSGTSLFSALLNDLDNAVCLNEILYDVNLLPSAFAEIRRRLVVGEPIPNRYDSSGNLATDTQGSGANVEERIVQDVDENAVIGSKVNIPYLNQIQKILDYGYKVIALVRDPVYTIASWNSEKANVIPEAHVGDEDMHPRWRNFRFETDNKIERQAQLWQHYANLLWKLRNTIKIIRYTELTDNTYEVMQYVCEYFGLKNSTTQSLKNMNMPSRFANLDMISQAVMKHCPMANTLGYHYSEGMHSGHRASSNGKIAMATKPSVKEEFRESNVGPFVIFGRGHCGGRALCEAYTRNGIFMGKTTAERMDTVGFGLDNPQMLHILKHAFSYPSLPREKQAQLEGIVMEMVSNLESKAGGKPFGWKHGISIFCIEMLLRACPEARVVHLIRDGRDVMLSRLPARLNPDAVEQEPSKLAVFGGVDINSYKGLPLPLAVQDERLRNELEMIHWKTATAFGLRGRSFVSQYKEIKYEALCQHPVETLTEIFGFLGLPLRQETVNWAKKSIHLRRIGKWKSGVEDLTEAIALGEPLLSHLGYTGE